MHSIHVSKSETPLNPCFKSLLYFGVPNFQIEILLKGNSMSNWAVSIRVNMSIQDTFKIIGISHLVKNSSTNWTN